MRSRPSSSPATREFWPRAVALLILISLLGIWVWIETTPPARVAPPPGAAVAIDKSPPAQARRKAAIDKLLADGLVRRIDTDGEATVSASLRPAFYLLDEPRRLEHAQTIYAYYFDGGSVNDVVVFRDSRNGNRVGQYNPYRDGLRMYK